jgi:hypothetical protein
MVGSGMARARKSNKRAKRSAKSKRARGRRAVSDPERGRRGVHDAERVTLDLARRIATIATEPPPAPTSLRAALTQMTTAYASQATVFFDAWKRARTDKRAALALGWAREQLRLAVVELLGRDARTGRLRTQVSHDSLAWIIVALGESAVADTTDAVERIDALTIVLGPSASA